MIHAHKFDNVLWSVPPDVIFALIQLSFKLHSREATRHHSVADLVFTSSKKSSTGFTWQPWPADNNGSFHRKAWLLPFPDYNRLCCLSETTLRLTIQCSVNPVGSVRCLVCGFSMLVTSGARQTYIWMFDRLTVARCSVSNQQFINWSVLAESLFALLSEFEIGDWTVKLSIGFFFIIR